MPPWDPEHPVDAEMATRLATAAFPGLVGPPRHLGAGWDVDVWAFGDVAVRFPRRAAGVACLENELRVLPTIAPHLPAPVPVPRAIAEPPPGYPSRFYAHALLPGAPAIRADLDDAARFALAAPLARFLRALHAIPRFSGIADDPRGDSSRIAERGRNWLSQIADVLTPAQHAAAAALLAAPPPTDAAPVVGHGDFHAGNLLVDDTGALTAVIDWGDCAIGDPAIDLAIAWSLLPPAARGDFLAAYGDISPATWARARLNALSRHSLALLAWARDRADATVAAFALASLARVL